MNWLEMSDTEIMEIVDPIMDRLMQASTDIDHVRHVRDFSERLKQIVTEENLQAQCERYQAELGFFAEREWVGIFRKRDDVRVFWRQWYTKSEDEYVAFVHMFERDNKFEVINVSVS